MLIISHCVGGTECFLYYCIAEIHVLCIVDFQRQLYGIVDCSAYSAVSEFPDQF